MKFYRITPKIKRKERKELEKQFTALDKTVLRKAASGADIVAIIGACKPFRNKWGAREYAESTTVIKAVAKLQKLGYLARK